MARRGAARWMVAPGLLCIRRASGGVRNGLRGVRAGVQQQRRTERMGERMSERQGCGRLNGGGPIPKEWVWNTCRLWAEHPTNGWMWLQRGSPQTRAAGPGAARGEFMTPEWRVVGTKRVATRAKNAG